MNESQSMQDTTSHNTGITDNSIDVHNPPLDNFNPAIYQSNASYLHDPSGQNMMQSYTNPATIMVHQMVQQLQIYVKDNQDLKKSIKLNNRELEKRFAELEEWKTLQRNEKLKLKQNFEKAHKSTTHLKTENAFLKSENVKLELRISQLTSDSNNKKKTNDKRSNGDHDVIHDKYLSTVENLEKQLKDAISKRDEALTLKEEAESRQSHMYQVNMQLQQKLHEFQVKLKAMESIKENKRLIEISYQNLLKELKNSKEQQQAAEKANTEVKAQLLQLLKDVSAYQSETESLKTDKHHCHSELNEARTKIKQLMERVKKGKQDYETLQADRNQDKATYEKAINEKTQALDDLFTDYNTMRIENQRLNANGDNLLARIFSAEESLQKKHQELKDLRDDRVRVEGRLKDELRKQQEDVNFFKAQADVYKMDFIQEREDRTQTHQDNERLRTQLEQMQLASNRYDPVRR